MERNYVAKISRKLAITQNVFCADYIIKEKGD